MTKSTKWIDLLVIAFSLAVIGASAWGMLSSGVFNFALHDDVQLTWHLIRSSGIVAYVLMVASTVWGLFISSQLVKDWSPGPISITLHSTLSWLALALGLGHGLMLMFDDYFTYSLSDVLVPFSGPYRPEVVGLGTVALWMIIAVTLSFPLRKRLGHTLWKRLHYLSYAAFGLVTAHGLFAGTDAEHLGFRLLTGIGVLLVVLLLGMRLGRDQSKPAQAKARKSAAS